MKSNFLTRNDKPLALAFILLSLMFLLLSFTNKGFFQWAFERHQNQLSWYIRPLFLIPYCVFAYRRSLSGIFCTLFLLLTSMLWFPKPDVVSEQVTAFLQMEQDYLTGEWTRLKVLITLIVPLSLTILAVAFWKRSLWFGIAVLVFIAVAKMLWSVVFGGESGQAIIAPAIIGLLVCIALLFFGVRRQERKKAKNTAQG